MTLRIGLASCFFHSDPKRPIFKGKTLLYMEQSLSLRLLAKNVLVFLIPQPLNGGKITLKSFAQDLDGLVLQGGSDLSPKSYGETPEKPEWAGDAVRDAYEIELLREFMNLKKPILGVCRGAQLLNVAFGGTLHQDIPNHRNWEIYDQNFHEIEIEAGSGLAKLYPNQKTAKVNAIHHQAIKKLGKNLVAEAKCVGDGIIEAIRYQGPEYIFGVQWHPEFHDPKDHSLLDSEPIFDDFIRETKERQK